MFNPATVFDTMIRSEWNLQPSSVRGICNADTAFYQRQLYRLIYGRYDFDLPKQSEGQVAWKYNLVRFLLFGWGSMGVFYTKRYGWLPLPYSVLSIDEQYNPRVIQSSSSQGLRKPVRGIVGFNAGLVQVYDDFYGMWDIVTHYATKLASIDKGVDVNLMNTSLGLYVEVDDPKEGQDVKQAYEEATTGKPLVVSVRNRFRSKGARGEYKTMLANPKNAYLVNDFLDARRTIIDQFLTDIGVANANTDKRERLIKSEVEANDEEVRIARDYIADNIQRGFDQINKISGLNLRVRPHKGGDEYVRDNADGLLQVSSNTV